MIKAMPECEKYTIVCNSSAIAGITCESCLHDSHVIPAMSGAPDYEQKELQSNEKHVSAVLRMA